jgi:hypothetical protein
MRGVAWFRGQRPPYDSSRPISFSILVVAVVFCLAILVGCGGSNKSRSVTSSASPVAAPAAASGPSTTTLSPPTFARSVNLQRVSGRISIELPATNRAVALPSARQVPVGTVVDASAGVVRLTAELATPRRFDAGDFQAGVFEILQDRTEHGLTELRIRDTTTAATACGHTRGQISSRRLSTRLLGLLLGTAHGSFRTRGEFSAATVRGTTWGVRNRCDGTLTIVRRGVVVVTDFALHKDFVVTAGHSFLAKAP